MIRRNSLSSIEIKRNKIVLAFLLLLIVIMTMGFFYFKYFAIDMISKKQVERMYSYNSHNAKLANKYSKGDLTDDELKNLYYMEDENVYIVRRTGKVVHTINSIYPHLNNIDNIFSYITDINDDKKKAEDLKGSMLVGANKGNANISFNEVDSIACYTRVEGAKGWYIVSIMPTQEIVKDANDIILKVRLLVGFIILGSACIGLFYYRTDKRFSKTLKDLIYKDELTDNISYARFLMKAEEILKENKDKKFAIYYADIKNFKYINDTFGYDIGDKLLIYISEAMKKSLGDEGIFARITADSFAVLREYENREDFIEKIYNVLDKISDFAELKKENYKIGVYVGVYCSENFEKEVNISEMLDRANMAQKSIKGSHEFHLAFYNEEIRERIIAEKEIEKKMETSLANGEFVVFYQPKYDVRSGEIVGAEALVRWNCPETGLMLPGKFIPLFEQNGFIVNLDQYVFETVCKTVREWIDNGKKVVSISINVSRVQFYRLDFVKRYTKIKNKYEIPDGLLELEFTESIVLENIELLQKIVSNLKASGFLCSIDDFGSGYSSLNILKNLPMDILKLDRLFFKNSENTERDKALIASVVAMARALKMKTVSEGIETWNQVSFLKEIGCDIIQGYVYSEPISRRRFEHLVEGKKRKVPEPVAEEKAIGLRTEEQDNENALAKYLAAISYSRSTVIETDYEQDSFRILKVDNLGSYDDVVSEGKNITESISSIIDRLVHPDDRASLKERSLPMGVLSSFYQGENKIITDFRLICENQIDYMWCRATIIKVETVTHTDFKSLTFIENIDENASALSDSSIQKSKEIENAINESYNMVYEFNYNDDNFNLISHNREMLCDIPENGELSWLREQYLKKCVHPDDLVALQNFLNPQNVKFDFDSGKTRLITQARVYCNDECKYSTTAITLIKENETAKNDLKVVALCQNINDIYVGTTKVEELTEYVKNAVCEYYDIVYMVNLKTDETTVIQSQHAFSDFPRTIKYSNLVKDLVLDMVSSDDYERVAEFLNKVRISTALKLGKQGNSCEFRRRENFNGHDVYHRVRATYMKIPSSDSSILFLIRDLGEIENTKSNPNKENDELNKLYKKETTEIIVNESFESLAPGETRAFILLDISKVESMDDNDDWKYESKAGLITEFTKQIDDLLSDSEIMCRSGGYEYVILSDKVKSGDELSDRLNELSNLLKEPLIIDSKQYKVTGNIGVSIYGVDGTDFEKLYLNADMALNHARCENPDSYCIYND